jgi:hypothetical protein
MSPAFLHLVQGTSLLLNEEGRPPASHRTFLPLQALQALVVREMGALDELTRAVADVSAESTE